MNDVLLWFLLGLTVVVVLLVAWLWRLAGAIGEQNHVINRLRNAVGSLTSRVELLTATLEDAEEAHNALVKSHTGLVQDFQNQQNVTNNFLRDHNQRLDHVQGGLESLEAKAGVPEVLKKVAERTNTYEIEQQARRARIIMYEVSALQEQQSSNNEYRR